MTGGQWSRRQVLTTVAVTGSLSGCTVSERPRPRHQSRPTGRERPIWHRGIRVSTQDSWGCPIALVVGCTWRRVPTSAAMACTRSYRRISS